MPTIYVPAGAAYVPAAVVSTVWLLVFQTILVGRYRGRSGIPYPRLYAEKAEMEADPKAYVFNCVQRAHQNTLENLPILLSTTLITSLKYPIFAASALGLWSLARVGYTLGYATGNPKKRSNILSVLHYPIVLSLLGSSTFAVVQLIQAGI